MSFEQAHADDLRQVSAIAIALAKSSFDPSRGVPLRAWKLMASRRAIINYTRAWNHSRSYGKGARFTALASRYAPTVQPLNYEPRIERGIATLPDRERETVMLHYWSDWPFREIAEKIGVAESTAKLYHRNAILKLKGYLCRRFFSLS